MGKRQECSIPTRVKATLLTSWLLTPDSFNIAPSALILHIAAVFPPNLEKCLGYLSQTAKPNRVHQLGEDILPGQGRLLQPLQSLWRLFFMPLLEIS